MTPHTSKYKPKSRDYTPKRSFKERVKNFFKVDIEKDLQEEEGAKVFERIKLFTLNRNNLFIFLALFTVIVNILVGFNLNFLYIRQILGFLFLILVPGLLIMLCFKIRSVGFWEYLVYTIGLSVAFIMFAGLAVNWTLPVLGITDKPLSLFPILICFNIFLIIIGIVAWKRNKDLQHEFTTPKLDALNNIFFIIPMAFPLLSILGAFLLNNHGPNILTMIMIGGIAVYVLLLVIFRKKLNENIWPWALLLIGLSILLMCSLRSWYISGWDIFQEQYLFQLTENYSSWSILNFSGSYNACLSITILPTILSFFLKINEQFIFKFIFQIIFSIISIIVYLFLKRYAKEIYAFMASFFFISQGTFFELPKEVRQEIAFLFFGLMLLVLFSKEINPTLKKFLFVIFGASMIVSHYSTAYIALALFILTYIFTLIYKIYENKKIKKEKIIKSQKSKFYLTWALILLLLFFGFLWYIQVTPTANDLISFAGKSISNLGNMFNGDMSVDQFSFLDQLNIFYKQKDQTPLLQNYTKEAISQYKDESNPYSPGKYQDYIPQIANFKILSLKISPNIAPKIYFFGQIIQKLVKIFIIIGIFYLLFFKIKKQKIDIEYIIMALCGLFLLVLIIILPFGSIDYSLERAYQQILVILSLPAILGSLFMLKFIRRDNIKLIFILIIFVFYFLFISGLLPQIVGGIDGQSQLNNLGSSYRNSYVQDTEVKSANWFLYNYNKKDVISADDYATWKLLTFGKFKNVMNSVLPPIIGKDTYVYLGYSNTIENINSKRYDGIFLSFNFPTEFLNDNKNKIYNNGGSEIFK